MAQMATAPDKNRLIGSALPSAAEIETMNAPAAVPAATRDTTVGSNANRRPTTQTEAATRPKKNPNKRSGLVASTCSSTRATVSTAAARPITRVSTNRHGTSREKVDHLPLKNAPSDSGPMEVMASSSFS